MPSRSVVRISVNLLPGYLFLFNLNLTGGTQAAGAGAYGPNGSNYSATRVYTTTFYELTEISTPASPIANRARLFIKDNGLGKTQPCVKFANGTVKVLATEG